MKFFNKRKCSKIMLPLPTFLRCMNGAQRNINSVFFFIYLVRFFYEDISCSREREIISSDQHFLCNLIKDFLFVCLFVGCESASPTIFLNQKHKSRQRNSFYFTRGHAQSRHNSIFSSLRSAVNYNPIISNMVKMCN